MNSNNIKVSVWCTCYNHEKYISKCLDGFINQKTNFKYEVIVHDDASTDNSAKIIKEYAEKYPEIIKPIFQKENQYSKNVDLMKEFFIPNAIGKYIAFCEGDDFWCNENKLQIQYDIMEENDDISMCTHLVKFVDDNGNLLNQTSPLKKQINDEEGIIEISNFLSAICNYCCQYQTTSYFITKSMLEEYYKNTLECCEIMNDIHVGDLPLCIYSALNGKIYYINKPLSCHRECVNGSWTSAIRSDRKKFNELIRSLQLCYIKLNEYTKNKYLHVFPKELQKYMIEKIKLNKMDVALITDDNYAMLTAMCINDIILNKKNDSIIYFHILINNISDNSKNILNFFNSKKNIFINLIDITDKCKEFDNEYNKINSNKNSSYHVSGASFMRCFLPDIFTNLDKMLYLDQDIYVNGDLHEFYDIDINDYLFAASIDTFSNFTCSNNPSYEFCKDSFDNKRYVYAGQLLMNLKKMREFDFLNKCISFLKEKQPPNKDMDVINAIGYGNIKYLDQKFCVPYSPIELAKNGYLTKAFLDINFYNSIIDTGCKTFEEFIEKGLIWHFYGDKLRDMKLCPELSKMFNKSKERLIKTLSGK